MSKQLGMKDAFENWQRACDISLFPDTPEGDKAWSAVHDFAYEKVKTAMVESDEDFLAAMKFSRENADDYVVPEILERASVYIAQRISTLKSKNSIAA